MKLKLDDKGTVVLQNSKPVYIKDDGEELAFDANEAFSKIKALNKECGERREANKDLNARLSQFGDIDAEAAKKALATVADLDDAKLIKIGEVDALKARLQEGFLSEKKKLKEQLDEANKRADKMALGSRFASSGFIRDKTYFSPEVAEKVFSEYFSVDGDKVVAKLNGETILSSVNHGEPADFDEALKLIVEKRADKSNILRTVNAGGSGAGGGTGSGFNGGDNPFRTGNRTEQGKLIKQDANLARQMANEAGVTIPGLNA